ncbi:MAG TPA: Cof-type HAD-IIB family hydrolase [Sphingobium sp.]|uniref:Cof-type HAD-IIB family hydrolase n=1 Tax=Sphingobium sp. TaxID=1912891 RepID=UPI002ED1A820
MASDRMMTDLGLLVSDVDGTLVRSDKSLSDAVVAAAKRLQAAGVPMSIISARPPSGMLWVAERLGLSVPIGAFNGGTIIGPDGTILSAARLEPEIAKHMLDLIQETGVVTWLFSAGRWHADRPDSHHDEHERKAANQEPVFGGDFSSLLGAVDKIVAVSDDAALLAKLEGTVARAVGAHATVGQSQVYYLDITAPAANKGDGVAALSAAIGVPLPNVAVIGDQRNDMPMFRRAGLSIAMGQGPEAVRAAAMHVTGSNDEDGVAQAIDTLLLPMVARQ